MDRYRTMLELLLSVGILFKGCDSDVKCRNDNGKEVDWYILYKYPKVDENDGLRYLYMDESTNGWQLSNVAINSASGTLANTLKPLFDFNDRKTEGFGYMLYNDQPPKPPGPITVAASYGHSKGVVMLDKRTGVWLSHSTPRFPKYTKDFWPTSGAANAQTFMCVTYSYKTFKDIGLQIQYIHPYSYDSNIPTTFHNELRCVAQRGKCFPTKEPWFRVQALTSVHGRKFTSIAKYTRFGDDLYSGLVVNTLKNDLYVKSWGKMRTDAGLPSNCNSSIPHDVYNVKSIKIPKTNITFKDTLDHSKWCVSYFGDWTCIADLNRQESQMERGGGALCIENYTVAEAFRSMIDSYEECKQPRVGAQTREL